MKPGLGMDTGSLTSMLWALEDSNLRPQPCEGDRGQFSDLRKQAKLPPGLRFPITTVY
jgi:hypothetical protein